MSTKSRHNPSDNLPSLSQQISGLLPILAVPLALLLLLGALHISIALGLAVAGVLVIAGGVAVLRISSGF